MAQIDNDSRAWLEEERASRTTRKAWHDFLREQAALLQSAIATHKNNLATHRAQLSRGGDDGTVAAAAEELERLVAQSEGRLEALNFEQKELDR